MWQKFHCDDCGGQFEAFVVVELPVFLEMDYPEDLVEDVTTGLCDDCYARLLDEIALDAEQRRNNPQAQPVDDTTIPF